MYKCGKTIGYFRRVISQPEHHNKHPNFVPTQASFNVSAKPCSEALNKSKGHKDFVLEKEPQQRIAENADNLVRKGLVWLQEDKLFSRWTERFLVLTSSYLQIFKKKSSKMTEMGEFVFKVSKHYILKSSSTNWPLLIL